MARWSPVVSGKVLSLLPLRLWGHYWVTNGKRGCREVSKLPRAGRTSEDTLCLHVHGATHAEKMRGGSSGRSCPQPPHRAVSGSPWGWALLGPWLPHLSKEGRCDLHSCPVGFDTGQAMWRVGGRGARQRGSRRPQPPNPSPPASPCVPALPKWTTVVVGCRRRQGSAHASSLDTGPAHMVPERSPCALAPLLPTSQMAGEAGAGQGGEGGPRLSSDSLHTYLSLGRPQESAAPIQDQLVPTLQALSLPPPPTSSSQMLGRTPGPGCGGGGASSL